jgi:hypothetical protein
MAIRNQRLISRTIILFAAVTVCLPTLAGCQKPAEPAVDQQKQAAKKDNRGIFGKTTQDIAEYDGAAGAVIDDGKVDEGQLATPGIGALAGYGPAAQLAAKQGVEKALQLFQAMHDRYPNSHDEFVQKVIKANNLRLPVLPGGRQYQYDVENHKLVVVKPTAAEQSVD